MKDEGLYVIFSRDIPSIIRSWLKPNVAKFLQHYKLGIDEIEYFIAHPGGKKVLEAYSDSLGLEREKLEISLDTLKRYGNMSSVTVLFVLEQYMQNMEQGRKGLIAALGPGFSSELLLVEGK